MATVDEAGIPRLQSWEVQVRMLPHPTRNLQERKGYSLMPPPGVQIRLMRPYSSMRATAIRHGARAHPAIL